MLDLFKKKGVFYIVDDEVQRVIDVWERESGLKKGSFGIILEKLGFDIERVVYLSRCSSDFNKIILKYSNVQSKIDDNNTITLLYNNDLELKKDNVVDRYECRYDKDVSGKVDLIQKWSQCNKKNGEVFYSRNIIRGIDDSTISISVENKKLDQGIGINIKFDDMFYATFDIYNEEELQDYLMNLSFPIAIDTVYFDVCRILGIDMEVYKEITLRNYTVSDFSNKNNNSALKYTRNYGRKSTEVVSPSKRVSYVIEMYDLKTEIYVNNGDYKLYFLVNFNEVEEFGIELDNESELQKYLMNLDFPISISEVYKKVCEISLGDVCKYSRVVLQCFDNSKNGMITDLIVLNDGNFEKFGMTKNGITVVIDKNDNFTYKTIDEMTDVSVDIFNDDKIKCEVSAINGDCMDDYIKTLVLYDISDARKEKNDVKKLVRKIFSKEEKDSN